MCGLGPPRRPSPRRGSSRHCRPQLDREAAHPEAVRAGGPVRVGQFLDLAVLALDAGPMRRRRVGQVVLQAAGGGLPERKVIINKDLYDRLAAPSPFGRGAGEGKEETENMRV